jgi:hypothetical protein
MYLVNKNDGTTCGNPTHRLLCHSLVLSVTLTGQKNNPTAHTKNVSKVLLELKSLLNLVASDESLLSLYGLFPSKHIIFTALVGVHPYRMGVRRCSFPRPFFISRRYFLTSQTATT